MAKIAENISFTAAKETINTSYFNHKLSKDDNNTDRISVNLRILFNRSEVDRNELSNKLQEKS